MDRRLNVLNVILASAQTLSFIFLFSFIFINPSVASADIDTGMVAHWTFDDASGTTAVDSSGNGNNATLSGTTTWSVGKRQSALTFDGSTDSYARVAVFNNTPSSNMTICSWVKTSTSSEQVILQMSRSQDDFANEGVLKVLSNGKIMFWDYASGATYGFATNNTGSTDTVNDGNWHLACFVKNGTSGTYYVDGSSSGSITAAVNISYGNANWVVGRDYRDRVSTFNGSIDDVRVYNTSLSSADIAALYGLVGYWKFDDASGTTAVDSSGYGSAATLVGSPAWTNGKKDGAISFTGSQYASISSSSISSSTASSGGATAVAWVYTNSAIASSTIISNWPTDSSGSTQFRLGFNSAGKIALYIRQSNGTLIGPVTDPSVLTLNAWHSVGFTADSGVVTLYRDGLGVASTTYDSTLAAGGSYIGVGATLDTTNTPESGVGYFDGKIDDVHVYNFGLTSDEMFYLAHVLPIPVTGIGATGNYRDGVTVTWSASPADEDVTDYVIQRSNNNGNSWSITDTSSTTTSYTLTSLSPGDYLFKVAAVNIVGQGSYSSSTSLSSSIFSYSLTNSCSALQNIASTTNDAYGTYTMSSSIDCSGVPNFRPISFSNSFQGIFNGNGFAISNLTINSTSTNPAGLFSIASNATFSDISLLGGSVTGSSTTGALIGSASNVIVTNATSTLNVSCQSGSNVTSIGGLIGTAYFSTLTAVSSSGNVSCSANGIGGLVGSGWGLSIDRSFTTGSVTGNSGVGGLVGNATGFGGINISRSFSTADIIGGDYVGGLVGTAEGDGFHSYLITDSFASSTISKNLAVSATYSNFGGLVGYASIMSFKRDYFVGSISATGNVGGLIGQTFYTSVTDSFSAASSSIEDASSTIGAIIGSDGGSGGLFFTNEPLFYNNVADISHGDLPCNGNISGSQSGCMPINSESEPNPTYFFNTYSVSPFTQINHVWNFASVWELHADTYPTLTLSTSTESMLPFPGCSSSITTVGNITTVTTCGQIVQFTAPTFPGFPSLGSSSGGSSNSLNSSVSGSPRVLSSSQATSSLDIATSSAPYLFTKNLKKGMDSSDVQKLQQFLNAHGFIISKIGAGSPGNETTLFGSKTVLALNKFQSAYADQILKPLGIKKPTGLFYGATRAVVNSMLSK